jgi:hypothetical protein
MPTSPDRLLEDPDTLRRTLLLTPLFAALAAAIPGTAEASKIRPSETSITLPDKIKWKPWNNVPDHVGDTAELFSSTDRPGPYVVLMKWYPGFMSAPHTYRTDRFSMVLSGTWWVNSGADFDPANTVPVPAGGFVHRVARTPHYDGVKPGESQPAVIALFGIGPVDLQLVDPSKPPYREL